MMHVQGALLGDYLRARRSSTSPESVGIRVEPGRRVPGLRREEVARLAGISQEYYLRLEQGRDRQPSDQVLRALGNAMRLDRDGVEHMRRLVVLQHARAPRSRVRGAGWGDGLRNLLQQWGTTPAYIRSATQDVVMANHLAEALSPEALRVGSNIVLTLFSDNVDRTDPDWAAAAARIVASLRYDCDPRDPRLQQIVTALETDADFVTLWDRHEVRASHVEVVRLPVGRLRGLELQSQTLLVPGDGDLALVVYHAAAGSSADGVIRSVGSAATTCSDDCVERIVV